MQRLKIRLAPVAAVLVLATGCAAGQVTGTNTQLSTVDGTGVNVGDIALRDITFEYPDGGLYESGDSARLLFTAVNRNPLEPDALVDVTSPAFEGDLDSDEGVPIELPARVDVSFQGDGAVLELTDLAEELRTSVAVDVTFVFENAGEVTVQVPVAVPLEYEQADAEPFDFHEEPEDVTGETGGE
ncbi:hypothetical protein BH18ACT7_BH18ACT7_01940 [soil metagenome]